MSVNRYTTESGLQTLANGQRIWIGTKDAYNAAKQAGTLPTDCLIAITDDENDRAVSGTNLLDNPWFTVNQRGQSSYTNTWSYTLDRWRNLALSEINVVDDGVQLVRGGSSDVNSGTILQKIEEDVVKLLDGKTITISALLSSGALVTNTGTFVYKGGYDQLSKTSNGTTINITSNSAGTENSFKVVCADVNSNITVRAVKLELGSASTLENDIVPNYATELLKCQRYFQRLELKDSTTVTMKPTVSIGIAHHTGSCWMPLYIENSMRSSPTLTLGGDFIITATSSTQAIASTSDNTLTINLAGTYTKGTFKNIKCEVSTNALTVGASYKLLCASANDPQYLDFSADL